MRSTLLTGVVSAILLGALASPAAGDAATDAQRLATLYPTYLDEASAAANIAAAKSAITEDVPAKITYELLLGIAYNESRFDASSVSRLVCGADGECTRKTGRMAKGEKNRGPYFCGVLQVKAGASKQACKAFASDLAATYVQAVAELTEWWGYCGKYKDEDKRLRCALLGHGGGWKLIEKGMRSDGRRSSASYPNRCLAQARRIKRTIDTANNT